VSETIYDLARDLREAQAMANALVPYVHEDALYGRVGGRGLFSASAMPSLTIGALLMRVRRLRALEARLSAPERETLKAVEAQIESVRQTWTLHFSEKLVKEANSRLRAIEQYFKECEDDPRLCAGAYLPEALRRTIVQEIAAALESYDLPVTDLQRSMRLVDGKLRRHTEPSAFIWAAALQPVYPDPPFWWLYAKPALPSARQA
jgi:hypothetical protein